MKVYVFLLALALAVGIGTSALYRRARADWVTLRRAETLARVGWAEAAADLYDSVRNRPFFDADKHRRRAILWLEADRPENALHAALDVVARSDSEPDQVRALAGEFQARSLFEEAARVLAEAVAKWPQDANLRLEQARTLSWLNQFDASIEAYRDVVEKRPAAVEPRAELASVLQWASRNEEALSVLEDEEPGIKDDRARRVRAEALMAQGAHAAAARAYADVLLQHPDDRAARAAYASALRWSGQVSAAAEQYGILLSDSLDDQDAVLDALTFYAETGDERSYAALFARMPQALRERKPVWLAESRRAMKNGDAARARECFRALMAKGDLSDDVWAEIAGGVQLWGDFALAERICRERQAHSPDPRAWILRLADVWRGAQRFHGAQALYERLLSRDAEDAEALSGLTRLHAARKDWRAAVVLADRFIESAGDTASMEMVRLRAIAAERLGDAEAAGERWRAMQNRPEWRADGLTGEGLGLLDSGRLTDAVARFRMAAELAPDDGLVRLLTESGGLATMPDPSVFSNRHNLSAAERVRLGDFLAERLRPEQARAYYRQALLLNPEHVPARRGLAQVLAVMQDYEGALETIRPLTALFPESSALAIEEARLLAWSRRFDEAEAAYIRAEEVGADPALTTVERARALGWAGEVGRSMRLYRDMFEPTVDEQLADRIEADIEAGRLSDPVWRKRVAGLRPTDRASPFEGYDDLWSQMESIFSERKTAAESSVLDAVWRLRETRNNQKSAWLEWRTKQALHAGRYREALALQEDLLAFQPGHEEAWFDRGQAWALAGRAGDAGRAYRELLRLSPLHSLARTIVDRAEIQARPGLDAAGFYWREKGRDGISDLERLRGDVGLDVPVRMHHRLGATYHLWRYEADGTTVDAQGWTLAADAWLTRNIQARGHWTRRQTVSGEAADTDGYGAAMEWFGLRSLRVAAGGTREDAVQNRFALLRGIQADSAWLRASGAPVRRASLTGMARILEYSDDNDGVEYQGALGYDLTGHPRQLNLSLHGLYRDTRYRSAFVFGEAGTLLDIRHPYWTPDDYFGYAVMLGFYHDLSRRMMEGLDRHGYHVKFSAGDDTENNPMMRLEIEWRLEWAQRAHVAAGLMAHRSREWDADSAFLRAGTRF